MASVNYFRYAEDGAKITVKETFTSVAAVDALSDFEFITSGSPDTWTKITSKPVSELACWKVEETRDIPGNPVNTREMDKDGKEVDVVRTIMADADITAGDDVTSGVWTQTTSEPISALVARKVVRTRDVPGNAIVQQKTDIDGAVLTDTRTLKELSTVTVAETIVGGTVWKRVATDPVTEKVGWEVVTTRPIA